MASGIVTVLSVSSVSAHVFNAVIAAPGATGIAIGDHLATMINGGLSTTGGVWRVTVVTDAQHIQLTDDLNTSGYYGTPGTGKSQFYTPTTNQKLAQSVDLAPFYPELERRDNRIVDAKLTDAASRITTLEQNPSIRIFALEATLLATSIADGGIGYAQDTDHFWFREDGDWAEFLILTEDEKTTIAEILEVQSDGISVDTGFHAINFSEIFNVTQSGTTANVDLDLLSDATPTSLGVGSGSAGDDTQASRADHTHALAAAGDGTITSIGSSNSGGSSPTVARGDHQHSLPLSALLSVLAAANTSIGVNGQKITDLGTPTASTDAATKGYVDNIAGGNWKYAVQAATTANIMLSGTQTIDGVSVGVGDRVLVKDQSLGATNGIYSVASGAWARATDVDISGEIQSMMVLVQRGTVNANTSWLLTTQAVNLGTTVLTYVRFSGLGQVTAGSGLAKSADTIAVSPNVDGSIVADGSGVRVGILASDAQHGDLGGGTLHATATTGTPGFMSAADKTKLNGITTSAAAVTAAAPQDVTKATAAVGVATTAARADHKHDVSTAAPGTIAVGASASEGSASSLARSDHTHALTAPSAPADVTKAAASAGSSSNVARADHKHDVSTAAPSTTLSPATSNGEGTATSVARSDHTHAVSTSSSAQNVGTANAAGSANTYSRGDHVHALTFSAVQTVLGTADGDIAVNDQKITGLATPVSGSDAATKSYVDAAAAGIDWKASVRAATTANIALSGAQTIDGVSVIAGNRVLVKNQTGQEQNGIYVAASGSWTRATDADVNSEVTAGLAVFVEEGTTNADTGWLLTTNGPIVLGADSLVFTQFTGIGALNAGAGLTKSGNTVNVIANGDGSIVVNSDDIQVGVLATDAQHGNRGNGSLHSVATTSAAGFMSAADKTLIDNQLPTAGQKAALAGTDGTVSGSNKYVTNSDARMSDARTPTAHHASHQHGGSDEIASATAGANVIPKANGSGKIDIGFLPTGTSGTTVVVGNDTRVPTQGENDALVGTDGTPSSTNKYVTDSDARNTDARTPTTHHTTHQHGGSDEIATVTPGSFAIPMAGNDGKIAVGFIPVGTSSGTIAAGDDARLPTSAQKSALAGTNGSPGSGNPYVTDSDARNTNARTPTGSAGGDLGGTYPNPTVTAIHELGGQKLTLGTVAHHQFLRREGTTLVGYDTTIADHGSTHLENGADPIPDATNDVSGLLPGPFFHKLSNVVDLVADYGLVSDADDPSFLNWTDNTIAFRDAVRDFSGSTNRAKSLYLPAGEYAIGDLEISRSVRIFGDVGSEDGSTILRTLPGKHGIMLASIESSTDGQTSINSQLENLVIDGNATAALPWAPSTTKAVGNFVVPTVNNRNHLVYKCTAITTGLTHASVEPTWPSVIGNTVVDAGVTWTAMWGVGLLAYAPFGLENVTVTGFDCDNIYLKGDEDGTPFTSVKSFRMRNVISTYSSQSGLYIIGDEASYGVVDVGYFGNNEVYGLWDKSTYGNRYESVRTFGNGVRPFKIEGANNRSTLGDCSTDTGENPSDLSAKTLVVNGSHDAGFESATQQRLYDGEWHAPLLKFLSGAEELAFDEIADGQLLIRDGDTIIGVDSVPASGIDYFVSVLDFGADPTGVSFNDTAFKAALDSIDASTDKVIGLVIPSGSYLFSRTWYIDRYVHVYGGGQPGYLKGTILYGRKGYDVVRVAYHGGPLAGGGTGAILQDFAISHQSGTGTWQANTAGYLADQSAVHPVAGYNGHWEDYDGYVLRCIKNGTSGASEPDWDAHGYGNVIADSSLVRSSNVVTATTLTPHGKTTGNSVYIMSEDENFASGFYTITVLDSDTFTYSETGPDAVNDMQCFLADVITDNTTAWIKVYVAGLKFEAGAEARNITASGIGGDGISVFASTGDGNNGNGWMWSHCNTSNCLGWGFLTKGADSNAGTAIGCFAIQNGYGGFLEGSFLGNEYIGCGAENNGIGIIDGGIGPGFIVPEAALNNCSTINGTYMEGGQRGLINGRAMFFGGIHPSGVYGTGNIFCNDRTNTMYFLNDTNDDNTGLGAVIRVGRTGSQRVLEMGWSQNSYDGIAIEYGVVNGSSAGATGWASWGGLLSNFAFSMSNAAEGAGHFWAINKLYIGTVGLGRVSRSTIGIGAPSSGTWETGEIVEETRPDITGAYAWKCMSAGTPGTWAPIFPYRSMTVSGIAAIPYTVTHIAFTSGGSQANLAAISGGLVEGKTYRFSDVSGNAGAAPHAIVCGGSDTIEGDGTFYLNVSYGTLEIQVRGGNWIVTEQAGRERRAVRTYSASTTLKRSDVGCIIQNESAGALCVYTLPASPKIGDWFTFDVESGSYGIRVLANTGQSLRVFTALSSTAGNAECATQGAKITFVYTKSNYWRAEDIQGSWPVT